MERATFIPFGKSKDHSIDYLLGILNDARVTTIQRLQNLTQEELHWQFADGWNTIGVLLSHIASTENFFRISFLEKRPLTAEEEKDILPGLEMGKFIPELITNQELSEYLVRLENSRQLLLNHVNELSAEEFHEKLDGYNPKTGHNLAWTLYHLAEDEIHHRGQISIIRKLYKTTK